MSLRREIPLYSLLLIMELLGGFAVLVAIGALDATGAGYGLFWILLLAGFVAVLAAIAADAVPWPDGVRRGIVLAAGAGVCAAPSAGSNRGPSTAALGVLLAISYWRGVVVTRDEPHYEEVQRRFAYGFGLLFVGIVWIIVWSPSVGNSVWRVLAIVGIAYTLIGMAALAAARLDQDCEPEVGVSVFLVVALQLGALFLASLIAFQIFAIDVVASLAQFLQPIVHQIALAITPVVQLLLGPFFSLASLIHHTSKPFHPPTHVAHPTRPHHIRTHASRGTSSPAVQALEFVLAGLFLAGATYLLWRIMPGRRQRGRQPNEPHGEDRRRLLTPGQWWRSMIQRLLGLLRRPAHSALAGAQRIRQQVFGQPYPGDQIRRTYSQVLRRAETAGLRRDGSVTPLEFQQRLQSRWPGGSDDFAALTHAYMLRRYGEIELTDNEADRIGACGKRLRAVMRE